MAVVKGIIQPKVKNPAIIYSHHYIPKPSAVIFFLYVVTEHNKPFLRRKLRGGKLSVNELNFSL